MVIRIFDNDYQYTKYEYVVIFFSIEHAGQVDLFEDLSIREEEKYRQLQVAYPVIFISFANIKESTFADAKENRLCYRKDI